MRFLKNGEREGKEGGTKKSLPFFFLSFFVVDVDDEKNGFSLQSNFFFLQSKSSRSLSGPSRATATLLILVLSRRDQARTSSRRALLVPLP